MQGDDDVGGGDADEARDPLEFPCHRLVAGPCRLAHRLGRDLSGIAAGEIEQRRRLARAQQPDAGGRDRRAARHRLQAAPGTAAAERAARIDDLVAELAGRAERPQAQSAVDHDTAADAGAQGEQRHRRCAATGAERELAQRRRADVVQQANRRRQPLAEQPGHRYVAPLARQVRQKPGDAGLEVDPSGAADADGGRRLPNFPRQFEKALGDPVEDGLPAVIAAAFEVPACNQAELAGRCIHNAQGQPDVGTAEIDGAVECLNRHGPTAPFSQREAASQRTTARPTEWTRRMFRGSL